MMAGLYGCGTSDMKSGVAVALRVAHQIATGALRPTVDVTWICYDCEEIDAARNGLGRLARERPEVLQADLGILLEPSNGVVEGGCQGTLRAVVRTTGRRAHSARSWLGDNAVHALAPILARLTEYQARTVEVDGLAYREGLNAVAVTGGVAGNVIPDEASVTSQLPIRSGPDGGPGGGARSGDVSGVRRRRSSTRRREPGPASPTRWPRAWSQPSDHPRPRSSDGRTWPASARWGSRP